MVHSWGPRGAWAEGTLESRPPSRSTGLRSIEGDRGRKVVGVEGNRVRKVVGIEGDRVRKIVCVSPREMKIVKGESKLSTTTNETVVERNVTVGVEKRVWTGPSYSQVNGKRGLPLIGDRRGILQ